MILHRLLLGTGNNWVQERDWKAKAAISTRRVNRKDNTPALEWSEPVWSCIMHVAGSGNDSNWSPHCWHALRVRCVHSQHTPLFYMYVACRSCRLASSTHRVNTVPYTIAWTAVWAISGLGVVHTGNRARVIVTETNILDLEQHFAKKPYVLLQTDIDL